VEEPAAPTNTVSLCCLLISLSGMGMLRAEEYHFLRAVDIRMFCRPRPGAAATLQDEFYRGRRSWWRATLWWERPVGTTMGFGP
jgi:hypothetical protein